jgi:hypothetical protein
MKPTQTRGKQDPVTLTQSLVQIDKCNIRRGFLKQNIYFANL